MTAITGTAPGQLGHAQHALAAAAQSATDALDATRLDDPPTEQMRRQIAYARSLLHRAEHHLENHLTSKDQS